LFAVLLVAWHVWIGWTVPVAIMVITALLLWVRHRRRELLRHEAALRARAEFEHRMALAGDQRGIFGRFPPVQPGWFNDPVYPQWVRYYDGELWTGHVVKR